MRCRQGNKRLARDASPNFGLSIPAACRLPIAGGHSGSISGPWLLARRGTGDGLKTSTPGNGSYCWILRPRRIEPIRGEAGTGNSISAGAI